MKKLFFFALLMAGVQTASAEQVVVQTKNTTMVLNVDEETAPVCIFRC